MKKSKAFTLIELVSVLVILAILALIVTPLVLNIIKKASTAADRRSIDAYGRAVELAITSYTMDKGYPPTNIDNLEVEYTGKTVECRVKQLKENGGLYMSQCSVNGKEIKDSKTDDGYYHYGTRDIKDTEYLDMYANALETASLAYYGQNNSKVSDYTTLQIDYIGKEVSCDVTINYDGTIYLENCTVTGNPVENYTYGEIKNPPYSVGDQVTYNNVDYYVIEDSAATKSTVKLLKVEPLTVAEVNQYGSGHVNMHTDQSQGEAYDKKGYGGMQYYSSDTCGYNGTAWQDSGCTTSYAESEVKYVVDAWAEASVPSGLEEARLISYEELTNDLGCSNNNCINSSYNWLYNVEHYYWTMSPYGTSSVWRVFTNGILNTYGNVSNFYSGGNALVRPVIVLSKSVL